MRSFREVNWFRLCVVVGMSLVTSLATFYGDEILTRGELCVTFLQGAIVAFSFLNCPEAGVNKQTAPKLRRTQ